MRSFSFQPRRLAVVLLVLAASGVRASEPAADPLPQAHAHNDYRHDRPLHDALDQGFCSVEADVFLKDGTLLIGHEASELRPERTLEALYLAPLRERALANGGRVYEHGPTLFLLVDVKNDAAPAYAALHELLARYGDVVSTVRDGTFERKAVTVVVSGNRDQETIRNQPLRYAGIDGRPSDLDGDEPSHVLPWISANWNEQFRWKGDGPMPDAERTKLRDYVAKAHSHGRKVRFWATPEHESVWKELLAAQVDLIGTDDLARLQRFLAKRR
ncbi:MAG: phosphatidylinositol-specific phospholipase C/glycerophosphodiester phosphodiesterase family protein [Planctomycetaceae bacterium]